MRAPRRSEALLAAAALAAALAWIEGSAGGRSPSPAAGPPSWRGLVDTRAPVALGQRTIVLLRTPSVAQRLAATHYATEAQERAWASQALAAQRQVLTSLAVKGVSVQPEVSYARVVDGFAAALDPRAVALLEQMPEVADVYPVRVAFPASVSQTILSAKQFGPRSGRRPTAALPGYDGRGVTIALLDTGVDASQPSLRGRVLPGLDLVDNTFSAAARADPQDPMRLERHGTEMAGILAGAGGPAGLGGVAPGASILPLRVAGWQPDALGGYAVYGRTDQLLAGLDRAVDPNGDGDCHDAARVALVGLAEPYAAFDDGPEAQAVRGALELNTLVVAAAGNDGRAGPAFGSIAGPAAAPAALAVAATDGRATTPTVRVVLRLGLDVVLDRKLPLLAPVTPHRPLTLGVAAAGPAGSSFFGRRGLSLAAGRAVVAPMGADPARTATNAARAGAAAVLLYGRPLPAGALRITDQLDVPVVEIPTAAARELVAAQRAGVDVGVALGRASEPPNAARGDVAAFSSRGLAFDGIVKPDLAAPGVGLVTTEPRRASDGTPEWGTVNGTSGAAATVAGAAALLAQMRPAIAGSDLKSLLVGYAAPAGAATATGSGTLDVGASAVGEVTAAPATLGFGTWNGPHWRSTRTLTLHNVSTRRLRLTVQATTGGESEALHTRVTPARLVLRQGAQARVTIVVWSRRALRTPLVTGNVEITPLGGQTLRIPYAIGFRRYAGSLITRASLSEAAFPPSDTSPAVLTIQAGNLVSDQGLQIEPVKRLDILLYDASGRFLGVLARLRDVLPGSYSFGITGRGPTSVKLRPGRYELRLVAWSTLPGVVAAQTWTRVRFRIE